MASDLGCELDTARDLAFLELIRYVAYAEHWLRHTEAFSRALEIVGLQMDVHAGLTRGNIKIESPYE